MTNRLLSRFFWHFDRAFGNSRKWAAQILYVLGILALVTLIFAFFGSFVKADFVVHTLPVDTTTADTTKPDYNILTQTISLIFNVTNLPESDGMGTVPIWWQIIGILIGAVVFTGFTITYVSNFLGNRIDAYREGTVRYKFSDHILFLGGCKMIPPMMKELYKKAEFRDKHFVVLTDLEVQDVRRYIDGALSKEEKKVLKVTVLRGCRDDQETLKSVHIDKAARIYIVGDNPFDAEHDSKNMACWNLAKTLCCGKDNVPCLLLFNRASSTFLFRHRDGDSNSCLNTTVINRLESVAQRVMIHSSNEYNAFPALDRDGIGKDSERTVHFVLYGMTDVSYALATMAAHLCHFPNFVECHADGTYGENKSKRTKITMIAPNIKEEKSYMTAHLHNLFSISKCEVLEGEWSMDDSGNATGFEPLYSPKSDENKMAEIGDFLDIEWEFIDGNIADEKIRRLLRKYYRDNQEGRTYFTLAMCQREADKNIAAAIYLPSEFHEIIMKEGSKSEIDYEKTIPIFVYQPESEEMLTTAEKETAMFKNIFPFGSVRESYDPSIRRRIYEGKRIAYIYTKGFDYQYMTSDRTLLNDMWRKSSYVNQMSNIYSAAHIGVKLRSVDNRAELTEEDIKLLAVTEHNRWNVEKLLMGFEALPEKERATQRTPEGLAKFKAKKKSFKHYCIAPYSQLLPDDCKYDTLIVENLRDVVGE